MKNELVKPSCFDKVQWNLYKIDLQSYKNGKNLDICSDCEVVYQIKMRKENRCDFPMKRIDKVTEFV